ncbi:hypothetical protein [Deinococcus cavernae]|nr:hypothetical protein [Deinococcus cavernae]
MPLLTMLALASTLTVPAPYEVQETQQFNRKTVILAAYVSPDGVGHSLLIVRDGAGKTLWKHHLGWKYHLDIEGRSLAVRTLLPNGQTLLRFFDETTGENFGTNRFVDVPKFSPLVAPFRP